MKKNQDRLAQEIAAIAQIVASHHGFTVGDLLTDKKEEPRVSVRQQAMLIARELTGAPFARIAQAFGRTDYGTARHACKAAMEKASVNAHALQTLEALRKRCATAISPENQLDGASS